MNSKTLAAAAALTAGVIISSAVIIYNTQSSGIYSQIVAQESSLKDSDLKNSKVSDIIVGMIPESGTISSSIFLIPPTTDYKTAYMNAISYFENINPTHGRDFNSYHCVYADGRVDFKNVISSTKSTAGTKGARKISVYETGSRGSTGPEGKSKYIYLNVNKEPFYKKSSVDVAFENSIETMKINGLYLFDVYKLDGGLSLHANKKGSSMIDKTCKADINIKACPNGERKFEGLEKIYNLKTLNADIFNPETDVFTRYKKMPKFGK